MIKGIKAFFLLATAALLVNCVNVDMETTLKADRSGEGKLVYSWDPSKNLDHLSIDENFAMIESNRTIVVTAKREYDSEGTHYKEIEWTFEDINKVDLKGLRYTFREVGDTMVLKALFEEEQPEPENEIKSAGNGPAPDLSPSAQAPAVSADTGFAASTSVSPGSIAAPPQAEGGAGLEEVPAESSESQEMEEMFEVMVRAALDGFRVKFQFKLPYPVLNAPGARVDGRTATWEIPLKELLSPDSQENFDEFMMVLKAH